MAQSKNGSKRSFLPGLTPNDHGEQCNQQNNGWASKCYELSESDQAAGGMVEFLSPDDNRSIDVYDAIN